MEGVRGARVRQATGKRYSPTGMLHPFHKVSVNCNFHPISDSLGPLGKTTCISDIMHEPTREYSSTD